MSPEYSASVTAKVWKVVCCEQCRTQFAYEMVRSAAGFGSAPHFIRNQSAIDQANAEAQQRVEQELMQGFEAVPCPNCGQYQSYMISMARSVHRAWIGLLGIVLVTLSVLSLVLYYLAWPSGLGVGISSGTVGIVLLVIKKIISATYDPNNPAMRDERIQLAKSRTIWGDDYQHMINQTKSGL